jgi:hypothetical protein
VRGWHGCAEKFAGLTKTKNNPCKIPERLIAANYDRSGADHCMDAEIVPGVIFANRDLRDFGSISYRDIPFLAIEKHLDQSHLKPPSEMQSQGQEELEEQ